MHLLLQEEPCPVTDQILGGLYSSDPHGVPTLVETIAPKARAMLALYCYRRAHLSSIGLAIAACCERHDLEDVAGPAGAALFHEARKERIVAVMRTNRRGISLSTGPLRHVVSDEDE